jgi:hypothetical protein
VHNNGAQLLKGISVSTVLSTSPSRWVHDVNVTSRKGRRCIIDLYRDDQGHYETTVTVYGTGNAAGWVFDMHASDTSV